MRPLMRPRRWTRRERPRPRRPSAITLPSTRTTGTDGMLTPAVGRAARLALGGTSPATRCPRSCTPRSSDDRRRGRGSPLQPTSGTTHHWSIKPRLLPSRGGASGIDAGPGTATPDPHRPSPGPSALPRDGWRRTAHDAPSMPQGRRPRPMGWKDHDHEPHHPLSPARLAGPARPGLPPRSPSAAGPPTRVDGLLCPRLLRDGNPIVAPVAFHARWTEAYRAAEAQLGPVYDEADEERVIALRLRPSAPDRTTGPHPSRCSRARVGTAHDAAGDHGGRPQSTSDQ